MKIYNKIICGEIKQILDNLFGDANNIPGTICDYLWRNIDLKVPLSIEDALVDIPHEVNNKLIAIYGMDIITITLRENELPGCIKYIGKKERVDISMDISGNEYKILNSIIKYHLKFDINKFDTKMLNLSLDGITKYEIPIMLPAKFASHESDEEKKNEDLDFVLVESDDLSTHDDPSASHDDSMSSQDDRSESSCVIKTIGEKRTEFDAIAEFEYTFEDRITINVSIRNT